MDIQVCIRAATSSLFANDIGRFGVRCLFAQKNSQRRDIDNMLKLVLDACNKLVWADDTQVTEIMAQKIIDKDNPRTEIIIYKSDAPDAASRQCEYCDKRYRLYPSWQRRKYCSRSCSVMAQREMTLRTSKQCAHCDTTITKPVKAFADTSKNYFCDRQCKAAYGRIHLVCKQCSTPFTMPRSLNKAGQPACSAVCRIILQRTRRGIRARGVCEQCQGPTTKKKYKRCKACLWANIPVGHSRLAKMKTIIEVTA